MFLSAMRVGKFSLSALRPKTSLSQRSLKESNKIVVSLLEGTHTHTAVHRASLWPGSESCL